MSGKDVGDEVLRRMAAMSGSDRAYFGSRAEMGAGTAIYVGLSDLAAALLDAREALRHLALVGGAAFRKMHAEYRRAQPDADADEDWTEAALLEDALEAARACPPDPRGDEL